VVFCVFQAPCQVELENWVNSIHSACAAAFARHRGKTGTLHLLQEEIFRLDKAIESVSTFFLSSLPLQSVIFLAASLLRPLNAALVMWVKWSDAGTCELQLMSVSAGLLAAEHFPPAFRTGDLKENNTAFNKMAYYLFKVLFFSFCK